MNVCIVLGGMLGQGLATSGFAPGAASPAPALIPNVNPRAAQQTVPATPAWYEIDPRQATMNPTP